ncbi:MAG: hypothetical protein ACMG6H_00860 [Acidobacteriota bacterium]
MLELSKTSGIFENFEVNPEPFWPRVARWLGGSIALHLVLIACVVFIPPVRDALSIAAMFSGAGFVDRAYNKTKIQNEGDIVEITTEKFRYPEGYFAMDPLAMPSPSPGFPIAPGFTPANVPPSQLLTPSPTPTPVAAPSPAIAAKATPGPTPNADDEKEKLKVEAELDRAAAENGVKRPKEINTRPFRDLLADAKRKKDRGELKLDGQIELTVEADRGDDGKLINAVVKDKRGDKKLESVALDFVSALSDSGVLDFLEGTKHIKLIARVDDKNVEVIASSEVESEERARQMEKGFSLLIVGGRIAKRGKDEEIYYNHTQVSSKDKEVSVKFSISRTEMGALLTKYTAEK